MRPTYLALSLVVFVTGCMFGPRPVEKIANDLRRVVPPGWDIDTSDTTICIESTREVTLYPTTSLPAGLSDEQAARQFGFASTYQVTLSFVTRLTDAQLQRLKEERRPFERVLKKAAATTREATEAAKALDQRPLPLFYTWDYSIFADYPNDSVGVYPPEAKADAGRLMASLNKMFRKYPDWPNGHIH